MVEQGLEDLTRRLDDLEDEVRELRARVTMLEDGRGDGRSRNPGPSPAEEAPLPPEMEPPPPAFRPNPSG